MYYSNDPVKDAERYEADRERELEKYPECCHCGVHIQDDYCYLIDGNFYCSDCLEKHYKKDVESFID